MVPELSGDRAVHFVIVQVAGRNHCYQKQKERKKQEAHRVVRFVRTPSHEDIVPTRPYPVRSLRVRERERERDEAGGGGGQGNGRLTAQ